MKSISYNLNTEDYVKQNVELIIDGEVKGRIEVSEACLEWIELDEDVRGKGFYSQLVFHALTLTTLDSLMSNNRNEDSNGAWEHWLGMELDYTDECYVCIDNNERGLFFTT